MERTSTTMSAEPLAPEVARVVRRLHAIGLRDPDSLWARLELDRWGTEQLLADLNGSLPAGETPVTRAELGTAVAEKVREEADQLATSRWPLYAVQIAFIGFMIALLHPGGPFSPRPAPPPQLVAARDIPPYHVLVDADIKVLPPTAKEEDVAERRGALRRRYTTRRIRSGSPFDDDMLADASTVPGLSERRVATLRVIPPDAVLSSALPARVTLSAGGTTPVECADAWVLSIAREGTAATALAAVALPETCTAAPLNALLAARAIVLVWAPRP